MYWCVFSVSTVCAMCMNDSAVIQACAMCKNDSAVIYACAMCMNDSSHSCMFINVHE